MPIQGGGLPNFSGDTFIEAEEFEEVLAHIGVLTESEYVLPLDSFKEVYEFRGLGVYRPEVAEKIFKREVFEKIDGHSTFMKYYLGCYDVVRVFTIWISSFVSIVWIAFIMSSLHGMFYLAVVLSALIVLILFVDTFALIFLYGRYTYQEVDVSSIHNYPSKKALKPVMELLEKKFAATVTLLTMQDSAEFKSFDFLRIKSGDQTIYMEVPTL